MRGLKHCLPSTVKHYLIPNARGKLDNQVMLDSKEVARRLRTAMDDAKPPVTQTILAAACGVSPQAVNGWRKTGRIGKRHWETITRLTRKSPEYFLFAEKPEDDPKVVRHPAASYESGRGLSAEAMRWGRYFDQLPHEVRLKWWVVTLAISDDLPPAWEKTIPPFITKVLPGKWPTKRKKP